MEWSSKHFVGTLPSTRSTPVAPLESVHLCYQSLQGQRWREPGCLRWMFSFKRNPKDPFASTRLIIDSLKIMRLWWTQVVKGGLKRYTFKLVVEQTVWTILLLYSLILSSSSRVRGKNKQYLRPANRFPYTQQVQVDQTVSLGSTESFLKTIHLVWSTGLPGYMKISKPIGSMGLVYLPTFGWFFKAKYDECRYIYHTWIVWERFQRRISGLWQRLGSPAMITKTPGSWRLFREFGVKEERLGRKWIMESSYILGFCLRWLGKRNTCFPKLGGGACVMVMNPMVQSVNKSP